METKFTILTITALAFAITTSTSQAIPKTPESGGGPHMTCVDGTASDNCDHIDMDNYGGTNNDPQPPRSFWEDVGHRIQEDLRHIDECRKYRNQICD